MHLFLTSVLPFLAHNHASAAAFLTCRHHNFHASIIPEFLSDEERVFYFCEARQKNKLKAHNGKQYIALYNLFVQTPLMQFSPSLIVFHTDCHESILKPLLATKYFTRMLQCCSFGADVEEINNDLLQGLSKVQSLTKLDLGWSKVESEHLEIIINSFPSLETLTIGNAYYLETEIKVLSPPPPVTRTLRNLTMKYVHSSMFASQFVPHFPNLRKLDLFGQSSSQTLNLLPLSSSLPLLKEISLEQFNLENTESLKNLVHLSSLEVSWCKRLELSFLTQENNLPELTTLSLAYCSGFSTSSFTSLCHAPNLQVLEVVAEKFDNNCLQYLENMVHLRKLDLSCSNIVGDSRSLKTLMQNLFQLEELNLGSCLGIGGQGAIAGALYSTHSRIRILNLRNCSLVNDDLNGIGALNNTLEVLDLADNRRLTNESLIICKDLKKLKILNLESCHRVDDLSPLKEFVKLEVLNVDKCSGLVGASFKIFSEEPNSFPNLCRLNLSNSKKLTEHAFEHLSKNHNLVRQLKEVNVEGMSEILLSSATALNNICQFKGLRTLVFDDFEEGTELTTALMTALTRELMQHLKNIEEVRY